MSISNIEKSKSYRDAVATLAKLKIREKEELAKGTVRSLRLNSRTVMQTTRIQDNESIEQEHDNAHDKLTIRGSKDGA